MNELDTCLQQEELHWPPSFGSPLQQDMNVMYADTNGYVLCVGRGTSAAETHYGGDLESGVMISEPEGSSVPASTRTLFGKEGGALSFAQRVNGSAGGHTGSSCVQCGVSCGFQQKVAKMGFSESAVPGYEKQRFQDLGLAKNGNTVSGCAEKIRHENVKPGWNKPPRPPRSTTDPSKERHTKGISDTVLLRRARLEKIRSLKAQKVGKPSSIKTTLWALLFTVSFFVIVIIQGIYSQGTIIPRNPSTKSGQRDSLVMHTFVNDAANSESEQRLALDEFSGPLSSSSRLGKYYSRTL
ncbi:hypothetical protein KI387_017657, partial [Taxus chinensis]